MSFIDNLFQRNKKNISIAQLDQFMLWAINQRTGGLSTTSELRRVVPWLFAGIDIIAHKVADYPFEIQDDAGNVIDSSSDWQNKLGFTGNFSDLIYLLSSSLDLHGQAYIKPLANRLARATNGYSELRYWAARSITLDSIALQQGHIIFIRNDGLTTTYWDQEIDEQQVLHWWLPDPDVELGVPLAYPAQAALNASGVLFSLDTFFKEHSDNGLIKAFLAAVKNAPNFASEQGKAAKEKIENDLSDTLLGKKNQGKIRAINADTITITAIGEGLKELENVALTDEKRQDIAVALKIPSTILWSSDAGGLGGGGVSREDTYRLYDLNVTPRVNFIARPLNEFLGELGYKYVPKPEMLDVYQEDDVARSNAVSTYTSAINTNPRIAKFVMTYVTDIDLDEEGEAALEEIIAEGNAQKEQDRLAKEQAAQNAQAMQAQGGAMNQGKLNPAQEQDTEAIVKKSIEAGQFKRAVAKNPEKFNTFVFDKLNDEEIKALKASMTGAQPSVEGAPFRTKEFSNRLESLRAVSKPVSQ